MCAIYFRGMLEDWKVQGNDKIATKIWFFVGFANNDTKWAATWQKWVFPPRRLISDSRVFAVHSVGSWGPKLPSCGQPRLWSDWAHAQADLSLRWARMPFCWFCHDAAQLSFQIKGSIIKPENKKLPKKKSILPQSLQYITKESILWLPCAAADRNRTKIDFFPVKEKHERKFTQKTQLLYVTIYRSDFNYITYYWCIYLFLF